MFLPRRLLFRTMRLLLHLLHSIERMFESGLSEWEGSALEQYGGLAGRHRVCLEECAFGMVGEHLVVLEAEVREAAVLIREHVLNEGTEGLVGELVRTQVQVLRVVQLSQQGQQELVQDLGLAVPEPQQVAGEIQLSQTRAVREDHT